MKQQHQPEFLEGVKQNVSIIIALAQSLSIPFHAWLTCPGTMGARYFGFQMIIGMSALLFYAIMIVPHSPGVFLFFVMTCCWLAVHRLKLSWKRNVWGYRPHSRYVGKSVFSYLVGNRRARTVCEPIAAFIAAYYAYADGSSLSGFFLLSAVCLYVSSQYISREEQAKLQALEDARADQYWIMENMQR
ncbi:hypothetical protein [Fimbriiglobus ruber]|uniref:hypothetical protein n=1 Tax=Fimbriiglobus ruber TaxID=1908690 RepID=UPI000B4AE66E|nr:hypothetical protein [Fimbriiglobus ruber]